MVEMACEEHDRIAAGSQFITHTIGRVLGAMAPQPSAIDTRGYEARARPPAARPCVSLRMSAAGPGVCSPQGRRRCQEAVLVWVPQVSGRQAPASVTCVAW